MEARSLLGRRGRGTWSLATFQEDPRQAGGPVAAAAAAAEPVERPVVRRQGPARPRRAHPHPQPTHHLRPPNPESRLRVWAVPEVILGRPSAIGSPGRCSRRTLWRTVLLQHRRRQPSCRHPGLRCSHADPPRRSYRVWSSPHGVGSLPSIRRSALEALSPRTWHATTVSRRRAAARRQAPMWPPDRISCAPRAHRPNWRS